MSSPQPGALRLLLYALVPVVGLLLLLEGGLRLAGFEGTSMAELLATRGLFEGAYVHRRDRILGPWYLPDGARPGWVKSNPRRIPLGFHDEAFPKERGATPRMFTLGGSTTLGMPFEFQGRGFASRMEDRYQAAGLTVRVINAGVAGMDSVAFPSLSRELLTYQPDALLIYAGNNEVKGQLIEECTNPYRLGAERALNELATVRLLRTAYVKAVGERRLAAMGSVGRSQKDCMLDALKGAAAEEPALPPRRGPGGAWPARGDALYQRTLASFKGALAEVVRAAGEAGAQVWLAVPPINLLDVPNRSTVAKGLSGAELARLKALHRELTAAKEASDVEAILRVTDEALALDAGEAILHYERGLALKAAGRLDEATLHLRLSAEWDLMGDRVTPSLQGVIRQVCAEEAGARCVDVEAAFVAAAKDGIPGPDLFVDYCHPTFGPGTDLIAEAFMTALAGEATGPGP